MAKAAERAENSAYYSINIGSFLWYGVLLGKRLRGS